MVVAESMSGVTRVALSQDSEGSFLGRAGTGGGLGVSPARERAMLRISREM